MAESKELDCDKNISVNTNSLILGSSLPQDYQSDSGVYRRIKVEPFETNIINEQSEKKIKPIVDDVWGDEDNIKSHYKTDNEICIKKDADVLPKCIDDIFDKVIGHYEETALDRANRLKREGIKSKK